MTKKIYEILIDDLNGLDDDDELCKTFMLFVLGTAQSIIKKTAQSIIESGEIPTIKKCIDRLDTDGKLRAEISTTLHTMLCASLVVDDKWVPGFMYDVTKANFCYIEKELENIFKTLGDEPDEDEELD